MDDEYTTIKIPQSLVVKIDELREKEPQYRSRADVVEVAVRCFLQKAFFEYGWPKGGKKRILQRERNHSHNQYSKALTAILTLTLIIGMLSPILSVKASPTELHVGPGQTYATITAAIAAASSGDTIIVHPGTYHEQVIIDKPLTLEGANAGIPGTGTRGAESIVDADDPDASTWRCGFFIKSGDVTIDGFKTIDADEGVHVACDQPMWGDRKNVVVKNNYIDTTEGNPDTGIAATGIAFYSLYASAGKIYSVDGAVVQDNYIYQAHDRDSIWFQDVHGSSITIKGNKVDNLGGYSGIILGGTNDAAYVDLSGTVIENNEVVSGSANGIGIQLKRFTSPTTPVLITGNTLTGGGYGIRLWSGNAQTNVVAHFNNLAENTWGIQVRSDKPWASVVDAENNWWGDKSGPSGVGPGTGDAVSTNVDYDPWLRAPIAEGGVKSETVSGSGTVDARDEADTAVVIDAVGKHTITVSKYESNPGTGFAAGKGSIGKYIDVHLDDDTGVTQIEIRLYYTDAEVAGLVESSLKMYWWDGAAWVECSNTGVNTVLNYIWAIITATSTPNLAQLSGQGFGGGGNPAPAKPVGGEVFLVDKIALLAPYIVAILVVATGAAVIRRRRS